MKYKSLSFLHCKWIGHRHFVKRVDEALAQRQLDRDGDSAMSSGTGTKTKSTKWKSKVDGKTMNDLIRIVRKWRKDERPSTYYHESTADADSRTDVRWYDPWNVEIDRIIDHKAALKRKTTTYLVKWKGLSYDQVCYLIDAVPALHAPYC